MQEVIDRAKKDDGIPRTAQQSIPFDRMFPDGICRIGNNYYTKTIQFQDINYQFISGTAGIPLPEAVISTLPNDQAGIEDGLEVKPGVIEEAEIRVANGVWKFQGWDSDRKVICGSDLEFVGTWVFEEDVIPTQEAEPISESQTDPLPTSNPQTDTVTETDAPKESDSSPSLESKETETSIVEPTTAENTTGNHAVLYIIGGIVIVAALIAFLILRNKIGKKEEVK